MKTCTLKFIYRTLRLKIIRAIGLLLLVFLWGACERLFVEEIEGKDVILLSPKDGFVTGSFLQNFLWEPLDGADNYRIKIVKGRFRASEGYVVDTPLYVTEFDYALFPGEYEWTVSAENYYEAAYSDTFSITIDSSGSSGNYIPILKKPTEKYQNKQSIIFEWEVLSEVERYRFEIRRGVWDTGSNEMDSTTTATSITYNLPEGNYNWGVQSIINGNYSAFAKSQIIVDLTPPAKPELTSPEDGASQTDLTVAFSWKFQQDEGAPLFDSIFIAKGEDFDKGPLEREEEVSNGEFTHTFEETGTYHWKVHRYDRAGNMNDTTEIRSIVLK